MAVVFISPKHRQRMFFLGITIVFLLFLTVISFGVFSSEPKKNVSVLVFNKPKINIDMKIFDSDQFKRLQSFPVMKIQYSYKAIAKDGKLKTGFVSATSVDQARDLLVNMGLTPSEIKEVKEGRANPFTPYYQVAPLVTKNP